MGFPLWRQPGLAFRRHLTVFPSEASGKLLGCLLNTLRPGLPSPIQAESAPYFHPSQPFSLSPKQVVSIMVNHCFLSYWQKQTLHGSFSSSALIIFTKIYQVLFMCQALLRHALSYLISPKPSSLQYSYFTDADRSGGSERLHNLLQFSSRPTWARNLCLNHLPLSCNKEKILGAWGEGVKWSLWTWADLSSNSESGPHQQWDLGEVSLLLAAPGHPPLNWDHHFSLA